MYSSSDRSYKIYLAYLAGIIDGEGTIVIPGKRRSIAITVANTSPDLIDWLVDGFGGNAVMTTDKRGGRLPIWQWRLGCMQTVSLLPKVIPFLVIKKQVAIDALAAHQDLGRGTRFAWQRQRTIGSDGIQTVSRARARTHA